MTGPDEPLAEHLNGLAADEAVAELRRCCASRRWAERMADARPFATDEDVLEAADRLWRGLGADDWLEAFAAHPRIGEPAGGWAAGEQAGMDDASAAHRAELVEGNRAYEAKFGHVFLICATARTAGEMAAELRRRLAAEPAEELRTAAVEQAKITRLRLAKLVET